jgi:5-deoxy-glucuronate isomerase
VVDETIHIRKHRDGFRPGYTPVTTEGESSHDTGIDFGIHILSRGDRIRETTAKETCWLLLKGDVEVTLGGNTSTIRRASFFDENPSAIHVPTGTDLEIRGMDSGAEFCVARTTNLAQFQSKIFLPNETRSENRGEGQVQGACTRIVRTVFDKTNREKAQIVLGEVVNLPGRWSSYPPHHHDQPEIYHYRFSEPSGYGHAELGEDVVKVKQYDTIKILDRKDHSQVSAPGYGMYYVWVIRHLSKNPYTQPEFTKEHAWTMDPKNQGWKFKP